MIDVGGTRVKLRASGADETRRFRSGASLTPDGLMDQVQALTRDWSYDVVALGYPGVVNADGPLPSQATWARGCIVATVEPHEHAVLAAIRNLGLEWHVIFNKGSVMALPADITKAKGLVPALEALGISAEETIGIGDAENDQAFLRFCGLAAAVDNALPSVKEMADIVTAGARGAGVAELIERWLAGDLESVVPDPLKHQG